MDLLTGGGGAARSARLVIRLVISAASLAVSPVLLLLVFGRLGSSASRTSSVISLATFNMSTKLLKRRQFGRECPGMSQCSQYCALR